MKAPRCHHWKLITKPVALKLPTTAVVCYSILPYVCMCNDHKTSHHNTDMQVRYVVFGRKGNQPMSNKLLTAVSKRNIVNSTVLQKTKHSLCTSKKFPSKLLKRMGLVNGLLRLVCGKVSNEGEGDATNSDISRSKSLSFVEVDATFKLKQNSNFRFLATGYQ